MCQKLWIGVKSGAFSCRNGLPEMLGVPVDDDGGEQVQPWHAVVLTFDGPISDFTLATDAKCIFEGMMGLALVETDLGAALHVSIKQPNGRSCTWQPRQQEVHSLKLEQLAVF